MSSKKRRPDTATPSIGPSKSAKSAKNVNTIGDYYNRVSASCIPSILDSPDINLDDTTIESGPTVSNTTTTATTTTTSITSIDDDVINLSSLPADDDVAGDDTAASAPQKAKHKRKWRSSWLTEPEYSDWLRYDAVTGNSWCEHCRNAPPLPTTTNKALSRCRLWQTGFAANDVNQLKGHLKTDFHDKNTMSRKLRSAANDMIVLEKPSDDKHSRWRMIWASIIGKHNLSFKLFPDMIRATELITKETVNGHKTEKTCSQMVQALSRTMLESLITTISDSPVYAIIIDETSDVQHTSRLAIYVRYWKEDTVECSFLTLLYVKSTSGEDVSNAIVEFLKNARGTNAETIELYKMVALATDGCSAMTGPVKGAQLLLKHKCNPYLICTHCVAHRLALAAKDAFESVEYLAEIDNFLSRIYNWFGSSNVRKLAFSEVQKDMKMTKLEVLQPVGTRWLSRSLVVARTFVIYPALVKYFSQLINNSKLDPQQRIEVKEISGYLQKWTTFAWIYYLKDLLGLIACLSKSFQSTEMSIVTFDESLRATIVELNDFYKPSKSSDNFILFPTHIRQWITECKVAVRPDNNKVAQFDFDTSHKIHYPDLTDEDINTFQLNATKFATAVRTEMKTRFPNNKITTGLATIINTYLYPKKKAKETIVVAPAVSMTVSADSDETEEKTIISRQTTARTKKKVHSDAARKHVQQVKAVLGNKYNFEEYGKKELQNVYEHFNQSFSNRPNRIVCSAEEFDNEWIKFKSQIVDNNIIYRRKDMQEAWKLIFSSNWFTQHTPNIIYLARIAFVIPVHTADCERGFSQLKLIKTDTRNQLDKHLSDAMRCSIESGMVDCSFGEDGNSELLQTALMNWDFYNNVGKARGYYNSKASLLNSDDLGNECDNASNDESDNSL